MPEEDVYKELVGFLKADRADLQSAAVDATLSITDQDGMTNLVTQGAIPPLCKLCSRPGYLGLTALAAILALSSRGYSADQCVEDMISCGATNRMTEIALTSPPSPKDDEEMGNWRKRTNYALAILANVTRNEKGAVDFCGKSMPDEAIFANQASGDADEIRKPVKPTLTLLLSRFLLPMLIKAPEEEHEQNGGGGKKGDGSDILNTVEKKEDKNEADDPYQHFAAVLMNATQTEQGRKFVMKLQQRKDAPATSVLQSILPQLRSSNVVRRRSIAGTIKNCCFDKDAAWWLLNDVGIISFLLYPLAGPEELDAEDKIGLDPDLWLEGPDKVREPDEFTRLCLIDSILLLLATGRQSRKNIRKQKTYVILKVADMSEESALVSTQINECVQYLRRDEEGTEEGSSDNQVDEAVRTKLLALPAPSVEMGPKDENLDELD